MAQPNLKTTVSILSLSTVSSVATIISAFFAPLVWNQLGKIGPQVLTDNVLLWITFTLALLAVLTLLRPKKAR